MVRVYLICIPFLLFLPFITGAQVMGCTDPYAINFNALAGQNDGSCIYPTATISPSSSMALPVFLTETSGLINWEDQIWTHNDSQDTALYALNGTSPDEYTTYAIAGVENKDWEEISQDSQFIYLGDFGNNVNGNRTDLKILRIGKSSLLSGNLVVDTLFFTYSDQVDFSGSGPNNTDFDCEAFIVGADRIYLFTKQWVSKGSSVYSLPKVPGSHIAALEAVYPVDGLITGATYLEEKRLVVLCGYSSLLQPFLFLMYDYSGNQFFEGNKRKIGLNLPFHQVEGICTIDGSTYYASNERFNQSVLSIPQKLHTLDLGTFLNQYLYPISAVESYGSDESSLDIYYSNGSLRIAVSEHLLGRRFQVVDLKGSLIGGGRLAARVMDWNFGNCVAGLYVLTVEGGFGKWFVVKK